MKPAWEERLRHLWAVRVRSARPVQEAGMVRIDPALRQRLLRTLVEDPVGRVVAHLKPELLVVAMLAALDEDRRTRPSPKAATAWRERLVRFAALRRAHPAAWCFSVNNGTSGHMTLDEAAPFFDGAPLRWPVGNSKTLPKNAYAEM